MSSARTPSLVDHRAKLRICQTTYLSNLPAYQRNASSFLFRLQGVQLPELFLRKCELVLPKSPMWRTRVFQIHTDVVVDCVSARRLAASVAESVNRSECWMLGNLNQCGTMELMTVMNLHSAVRLGIATMSVARELSCAPALARCLRTANDASSARSGSALAARPRCLQDARAPP